MLFTYYLVIMLTVMLKAPKNLDLSKSSLLEEETNIQQLKNLVQDQKRTIRKLTFKVSKLQQALSKERSSKGTGKSGSSGFNQNEQLFTILKFQMNRAKEAEQSLRKHVEMIQQLTAQFGLERFSQENTQKKPHSLYFLDRKPSNMTVSAQCSLKNKQQNQEVTDDQLMLKQIKLLQNGFRILYEQQRMAKIKNQQLTLEKREVLSQLNKEKEIRKEVQKELQMERRTRIKVKRLLQKSQHQKNQLMIKIDQMRLKQSYFSLKNPQEWEYLSKSLSLRINDLQKEKKQLLTASMREKQVWNKRYNELLRTVKSMQLIRK